MGAVSRRRDTSVEDMQSFAERVDPTHQLPEAERLRRAEAARREHFARLAFASSKARAKRAAERKASSS